MSRKQELYNDPEFEQYSKIFNSELCNVADINPSNLSLVDRFAISIIYYSYIATHPNDTLRVNEACRFDMVLFSAHLAHLSFITFSNDFESHINFRDTLCDKLYIILLHLGKLKSNSDVYFTERLNYYYEHSFDEEDKFDSETLIQSFVNIIYFNKTNGFLAKPDGSVPLRINDLDDFRETVLQATAHFFAISEVFESFHTNKDLSKTTVSHYEAPRTTHEKTIDKSIETLKTTPPDKKPPETSIEKYNPKSKKPYTVSLKNKYRYFNWYNIVFGSLILFCLVSVIVVLFRTCGNNSDTVSISQHYQTTARSRIVTTTKHEYVMQDEPRSGYMFSGVVYDINNDDCSTLTIKASSDESCVVKLKDIYGDVWMSFYVRAGDKVTVGVPRERLRVFFASGDIWYGYSDLFGEYTSYSKDSSLCDFKEYTYEYTLYPTRDGNFSETPISADEF